MVRVRFNRRLTTVLYHRFGLSLTSNCRWSQIHNERGDILMKQSFFGVIGASLLLFSLSAPASRGFAEEAVQDGPSYPVSQQRSPGFFDILGSIVFTTLHFPVKLVTCVGTQATAAVAYAATFEVEGHYDGGTNGRDIGETARRSCTGSWIVRPSQVVRDYGE